MAVSKAKLKPTPAAQIKPADKELIAGSYKSDVHNDWCPGCGDFGILASIQKALATIQLAPHNVAVFSGVGCSSKTPHFINTYGIHTLHGRVLPFSMGAKMANPELEVIAVGGDGDGYGIGAGHFVHAGRRNIDMTYLVYNNEVYGLTKGQASPTLKYNQQPKSLPFPNPNEGINPLALALSAGYTFIARSYAFNQKHLVNTIVQALRHPGMALVDVLQPCPTYNNLHTKQWFSEQIVLDGTAVPRTYILAESGYDGRVKNPADEAEVDSKLNTAFELATRREERIALGVFYQIAKPTYYDRIVTGIPILKKYSPATLPTYDSKTHRPTTNLSACYTDLIV